MIAAETMSVGFDESDAQLVALSLEGSHEAFARIVARYQSLICSLAYSASGNLHGSEDLAQETFLAAWKELRHLREPDRLRPWLCAIARNRIHTGFRKERRQPTSGAESIETASEAPSTELPPGDHAISQEVEAILWKSLQQLPETYREPLILFYREDQSVSRVAAALEMTEEAVRKRLLRGRKMLQEEVAAFVAGALRQTTPGKAFTMAVIATLPAVAATSAAAATVGTTAFKASSAAKAAAGFGISAAVLGPLIGLLGAFYGSWQSLKQTQSQRERRYMVRQTIFVYVSAAFYAGGLYGFRCFRNTVSMSRLIVLSVALGWTILYCLGLVLLIQKAKRRQRQIRIEEGMTDGLDNSMPLTKFSAYCTVGVSTMGGFAWMFIQAVQLKQWLTASIILAFGALVVAASGSALYRKPEQRVRIMLQTIVVIGIFTLLICIVNWSDWTDWVRRH
ncbi:MAG: polymerase [Verrucomicrobiales bacterium]|nr:polymerase [Verrucomicrobiales bacterium]